MIYPTKADFRVFIDIISKEKYTISKFLPTIGEDWYSHVSECVDYVHNTSGYEKSTDIHDCASRLIYKIAKRHELADGNKRTSVMAVYLFYFLNDYIVVNPALIKEEAKRAARSKGRANEELIRKRIAEVLRTTAFHENTLRK